jgi:3-phosphoshikimate 1-carboxyvinyltransferase
MLRRFGVDVDERDDGMVIEGTAGAPLAAAEIDAAGDHRIAMAAAVAALVASGDVVIRDVSNVATSFPTFVEVLSSLGVDIAVM